MMRRYSADPTNEPDPPPRTCHIVRSKTRVSLYGWRGQMLNGH